MNRLALIFFLLTALLPEEDRLRSILFLTGASDIEQLEDSVVERFASIAARPVRLNAAPRRVLAELLTSYQIASLEDYRRRFGDVLSIDELALVDGFGRETAEALAPFVSFASTAVAGEPADTLRWRHSAVLRGGLSAGRTAWGAKYRLSVGDRWELAAAARKSYTEGPAGTAYLRWQGLSTDIVLGDFNARFGQGLALWSGFYLSSPGSLDAFARRPGGIVPAWSYAGTGTHRGAAARWQRGRVLVSGFVSAPGLKDCMESGKGSVTVDAGANLLLYGMKGQGSLTLYHQREGPSRLSVDGRHMLGRADLFGEAAVNLRNGTPAFLAGALVPLGESFRLAAQGRWLPTGYTGKKNGEYGLLLGAEYLDGQYVTLKGKEGFGSSVRRHAVTATAEAILLPVPAGERHRRYKGLFRWQSQLSPAWSLDCRVTERWQNYAPVNRTDIRLDAAWSDGRRTAKSRLNAVSGDGIGLLAYLEAGHSSDRLFGWIRGTLFRVDQWNDRVYCYERDAPGSFLVPAYYGRGYSCAFYGGWKGRWIGGRWKLYVRASWTDYPFQKEEKPGKAELKLQCAVDF